MNGRIIATCLLSGSLAGLISAPGLGIHWLGVVVMAVGVANCIEYLTRR